MYENVQRFVLGVFELSFLQLLYIGFPVVMYTIIGTLAGIVVYIAPIMLVVMIGLVWFASVFMMYILAPVWSIPMGKETPIIEVKKRIIKG